MSLDSDQIIKLYLNRLTKSLIPIEFGQDYIDSVYKDLYAFISSGSGSQLQDLNTVVNQYKTYFLSQGFRNEWNRFQDILHILVNLKTKEQIQSYLVFFNTLNENEMRANNPISSNPIQYQSQSQPQPQNTNINPSQQPGRRRANSIISEANSRYSGYQYSDNRSSFHPQSQTSGMNNFNFTNNQPLSELIKPYYHSLNEQDILKYLSYTLLGSNSSIFTFSNNNDNLILPMNINNSYSGLLHKILEAALIYKKLMTFIENNKGKIKSPIKNAYLSIMNTELNKYMSFVNNLFSTIPSSLLYVYNQLHDHILKLRFIFHLTNKFELNGSDFLSEIHNYTQYGDSLIKTLSKNIFDDTCKPYYEILETWVLNGELIDINEEFFIYFDLEKTDLSIINFELQKIPKFFPNKICEKIFQIGKLIIFLKNYCNELDWLNNYNLKYSKVIYQNNSGLVSLSISQLTLIIDNQYDELIKFNNFVLYNKFNLIEHLKNYKNFLLMGKNDFIECIINNGFKLFNEPSNHLNSYQLTRILQDAINQSSIKNLKNEYQSRLDARILDLSHGNIGWQVFTLEYKTDKPLEIIINHEDKLLDYLKLFNFLWKLKKIEYLLNQNWKSSFKLLKDDLFFLQRKIKRSYRNKSKSYVDDYYYNKVDWLIMSSKKLNLVRNVFIKFIKTLINHLSFDLIEYNSKQLFKTLTKKNSSYNSIENNFLLPPNLSKISSFTSQEIDFNLQMTNDLNVGNETATIYNKFNLDELIKIHSDYLSNITNDKLLKGSHKNPFSNKSYIEQIYNFLEIIHHFIESYNEFNNLIVEVITIVNIKKFTSSENEIPEADDDEEMEEDEDLNELDLHLRLIKEKILKEIFITYKYHLKIFSKDLKNDIDLKDLGQLF